MEKEHGKDRANQVEDGQGDRANVEQEKARANNVGVEEGRRDRTAVEQEKARANIHNILRRLRNPSLSKSPTTSQSSESSSHSGGSGCSIQLCDHGRHLYAVNKHQHAQLEACKLRASKAEIGELALEKENNVLATRVSEVTSQYCTLGVDYAVARNLIKKQRLEIAFTRVIAGISIGIAIVCMFALWELYSIV